MTKITTLPPGPIMWSPDPLCDHCWHEWAHESSAIAVASRACCKCGEREPRPHGNKLPPGYRR